MHCSDSRFIYRIDILHTAGIDTQMLTCFTAASFLLFFFFITGLFQISFSLPGLVQADAGEA